MSRQRPRESCGAGARGGCRPRPRVTSSTHSAVAATTTMTPHSRHVGALSRPRKNGFFGALTGEESCELLRGVLRAPPPPNKHSHETTRNSPRDCAPFHCRGQWAPGAYSVTASGANPPLRCERCFCQDPISSASAADCLSKDEAPYKSPGCEEKTPSPASSESTSGTEAKAQETKCNVQPDSAGCCTCTTCCRWGGDVGFCANRGLPLFVRENALLTHGTVQ